MLTSKKLIFSIFKDLKANTLDVPPLPDIALKVRDAIRDPKSNFEDVAMIIRMDASLSTYLLKVANSPLYKTVNASQDITQALNKLGLNTTRNLTLSFAMRSIFRTKNKNVEIVLRKLWIRNTYLAALSTVLARELEGFNPEQALLAGLLQDIGALPIVKKLAEYPDILNDNFKLSKVLDEFCGPVGMLLLNHWKFEKEFVDVVRSRKDWLKKAGEPPCYADLVLVARYHGLIGKKNAKRLPRLDKLEAFESITGGKLTPKLSLNILQQAREEIKNIQSILK